MNKDKKVIAWRLMGAKGPDCVWHFDDAGVIFPRNASSFAEACLWSPGK